MKRCMVAMGLLAALCACGQGSQETVLASKDPLDLITQENLYKHIAYLADDALEGREVGQKGYDLAAKYVAEQYAAIGLEPGGNEGWYQPVALQTYLIDPQGAEMIVHRDGRDITLEHREDFVSLGDKVRGTDEVRAEVVYVGYGVHAPELGYSDLDGIDIDGKIIAFFEGGPQLIKGDKLAHYSSIRTKAKEWVARGAVGVIMLRTRKSEASNPWSRSKQEIASKPFKTWINLTGEASDYFPQIRGAVIISPEVATAMFDYSSLSFEDALDATEASEVRSMPLGLEVTLRHKTTHERISSPNVVGLLRGTDPALADEFVVYTAHLDGKGRTPVPIDGDDINNGMYDNALGAAIMIEAARALAAKPPRRSVLFVALTAEESGLLGSDYFAHHPTVTKESIVANVNMDMPMFLFPIDEIVAFGAEHSSLGSVADAAATAEGFTLVPDPLPEEILFSRSDQFSFVRQGVTAIWLDNGNESSDPSIDGPAVVQDHLKNHYHKPSDDLTRPIEWDSVMRFTRVNARIGWSVGNDDARPTWNDDSFYGNLYAPQ